MPNIKPISDLRNYTEVLRDIAVGEPVFLTKNGRGRYAILDIADYEKNQAALKLMNELLQGELSAKENGWQSMKQVKQALNVNAEAEQLADNEDLLSVSKRLFAKNREAYENLSK